MHKYIINGLENYAKKTIVEHIFSHLFMLLLLRILVGGFFGLIAGISSISWFSLLFVVKEITVGGSKTNPGKLLTEIGESSIQV